MSKFLAYSSPLYDTGGTPELFKAQIKQQLSDAGWQIIEDLALEMTLKPPAYELVGNDKASDVLRIKFDPTAIVFYPTMTNVAGTKKVYTLEVQDYQYYYGELYVQFGPSPTNRVTFTTVQQSYDPNLIPGRNQLLYDALIASTDPEAQKYDYELVNNPERSGTEISNYNWYVKATAKNFGENAAPDISSDSSMHTPKLVARGALPGEIVKYAQCSQENPYSNMWMSTPYSTGFVYYLSISARTIMMCVKTTTAIEGPLYATFTDHAAALAQTPLGCTPCEIFVGRLSFNTGHRYVGEQGSPTVHDTNYDMLRPSHFWGVKASSFYTSDKNSAYDYKAKSMNYDRATSRVEKVEDIAGPVIYTSALFILAFGLGAQAYDQNMYQQKFQKGLMPFDFAPLMVVGGLSNLSSRSYEQHFMSPSATIEDFYGTARPMNNESLHLVADFQTQTALSANLAIDATTIEVLSTAAFPDSGTLKIGLETMVYTGKTPTSFTGITRAREGSTAAIYSANEPVVIQYWVVVINKIGMRAGYNKPT